MNAKSAFGFAVGPILGAALGLVTVPAVAWIFSSEDIGRYNVANVAIGLCLLAFSLGLDQAYVREYHEAEDRAALLRACFLPGIIFFSLFIGVSVGFAGPLSLWLFGANRPAVYFLTIACALIAYLTRFLSLVLRMGDRGMAFSMSQVIPKVAFLLMLIALGLGRSAAQGRSFQDLLMLLALSSGTGLLIFGWLTRASWIPAVKGRLGGVSTRRLMAFGLPLSLAGVAYWALIASSTIVLRALSSLSELGIYAVTISVAAVAMIFQSIFTVIWAPTVYRWVAEGVDVTRVDRVARQALALVCLFYVLCGSLSWVVWFILPSMYSDVQYLVVCAVAQPLLYTLSEVTSVGIGISRRSLYSLMATIAALTSNLCLNLLLVPHLAATGAMVANALSFFVFFVARTEASMHVWHPFPRLKLYSCTGGAVALSVAMALWGPSAGAVPAAIWSAMIPGVAWMFRKEWAALLAVLRVRLPLAVDSRE